jgi:hypothetical protein
MQSHRLLGSLTKVEGNRITNRIQTASIGIFPRLLEKIPVTGTH